MSRFCVWSLFCLLLCRGFCVGSLFFFYSIVLGLCLVYCFVFHCVGVLCWALLLYSIVSVFCVGSFFCIPLCWGFCVGPFFCIPLCWCFVLGPSFVFPCVGFFVLGPSFVFHSFSRNLAIPHLDLSHFNLCIMGS